MDLKQYVTKSHVESILQKGMILGNYTLDGNKVELPAIVLQGNGVFVVKACVTDKSGGVLLLAFYVVAVKEEKTGRTVYQFRVRSALSSLDFVLTPQGGRVGTAAPIPIVRWPNGDMNITQLSLIVLEMLKNINLVAERVSS